MRNRPGTIMLRLLSRVGLRRFRPLLLGFRPLLKVKPASTRAFLAASCGGLKHVALVGYRAGRF
jgi:hypothetical protein